MTTTQRRSPLAFASLAIALTSAASVAVAQQRDPRAPAAPVAAASASASALTSSRPPPPPLAISDPMLEPVPPATHSVSNWREALSLVKQRSVELRIALADIDRAEAQGRIALAGALPTMTASANVTQQLARTIVSPLDGSSKTQFLPDHSISYGTSATIIAPIFAPRAWYAMGTADRSKHVAELATAEQRRQLALAVANTLVSVITAERVAELNRLGLRTALERQALTRRRAELGAATTLDVLRIDQDVAAARAQVVTGDESLRQAREALGLALGFAEPYGVPRDLSLDTLAQETERACPRAGAVDERTDIAVARERVEVTRRSVRDAELALLPTADVRTTYSITAQPPVNSLVVDRTNLIHNWSIAAVLTWNLFDGGIRYGNKRDALAQTAQAEARVEQARRSATIEVARALRGVQVAEQAHQVAVSARDVSRETDRLARLGFELGRGTSLELVDAARNLRQAEIQLALREFDIVQAKIRALLALSTCDY